MRWPQQVAAAQRKGGQEANTGSERDKNKDVTERKIKNKDLFAYMACPLKGYVPKWRNLTSLMY
jgi:hypothetical protein